MEWRIRWVEGCEIWRWIEALSTFFDVLVSKLANIYVFPTPLRESDGVFVPVLGGQAEEL